MKRFNTIRIRFAQWTAGLLLLVLGLFGTIVYLSMRQGLTRSLDDSLLLSATQAITAVNIENGQLNLNDSLPKNQSLTELQGRGVTIRILSRDGSVLQSVGPFGDLPVDQGIAQRAWQGVSGFQTQITQEGAPVRSYTAPIEENGNRLAILQVMQSTGSITETLQRLLVIFLISIPPLLLISALIGYSLAARALSPIDQMTRTAQRISAEDLSARLSLTATDDEIGRLAATFDQMLARLEGAFLRERQFTADASHDLRTPLTATQAIINVVRQKRRQPEEYEKALDDIAEETERLRTISENLLYIARGEARQGDHTEIINLSELMVDVAESLHRLAEAKGLGFTWSIASGLWMTGDSDALIRLFVNLIDNAVKYTEYGTIQFQAEKTNASEIHIQLLDTGKGIPAEHLPHIFERFYRVDPSRNMRGSGLGLAIALEIVTAHQGKIQVTSQVGEGTCFHIVFPSSDNQENWVEA